MCLTPCFLVLRSCVSGGCHIGQHCAAALWRDRMLCLIWTFWVLVTMSGSCVSFFRDAHWLEDWDTVYKFVLAIRNELRFSGSFYWIRLTGISLPRGKCAAQRSAAQRAQVCIAARLPCSLFRMCLLLRKEAQHSLVVPFSLYSHLFWSSTSTGLSLCL